ncbi:DUF4352 domain-containing protein [Streptomyces sp. HUAS MG47]|uniref:DUF4352 domain-containing protein n=1 Tax=Streptomyces solicamelliae TaxID=3231716 RepID=UPI00387820C2
MAKEKVPGPPPGGSAGGPAGPPAGPLQSRPSQAPPPRRRWVVALIIACVVALTVGVVGILVGVGAFGEDEGGNGASRQTAGPPTEAATSIAPSAADSPSPAGGTADVHAFGDTQKYPDGIEVTVSGLKTFTPFEGAAGHKAGYKAVSVDVAVTNGSDARLELATVAVRARDGDGRELATVADAESNVLGLSGAVLPGKKAIATYGFDLPPDAGQVVDVEVTVGFSSRPSAFWSGKLP